jgi:hypothetical protein
MRRARFQPKGTAARRRQQALGPMDAIGGARVRQFSIGPDQQSQSARAAQAGQAARHAGAIAGAKVPVNNRRSARQLSSLAFGIGRPLWVGKEKQRRNRGPVGVMVEPRRGRR